MKRVIPILMAGLVILMMVHGSTPAKNGETAEELFFAANNDYKEGRYDDAVAGYRTLIDRGYESGHLYYNLGNAALKLANLGEAILAYERARLFIPRDDDLAFNLAYARDRTRDAVSNEGGFAPVEMLGLGSVTLFEVFVVFTVVNILLFGILCIRLFTRREWTYYALIIAAILMITTTSAAALTWYANIYDDRAVVLTEEIAVRAGPDADDTVLFRLHEGTIVHTEQQESGWVLIHLSDEKRGWTEAADVARIR